jgi:hypothetical protein
MNREIWMDTHHHRTATIRREQWTTHSEAIEGEGNGTTEKQASEGSPSYWRTGGPPLADLVQP